MSDLLLCGFCWSCHRKTEQAEKFELFFDRSTGVDRSYSYSMMVNREKGNEEKEKDEQQLSKIPVNKGH